MLVPPEDEARARRFPVRTLVIANAIILVAGFFLVWGTGMFGSDIDWQGWIAIFLALLVTSGLGSGLMALAFFSSRIERDEAVYRVEKDGPKGPPGDRPRQPDP
jgi:hypothetical protein